MAKPKRAKAFKPTQRKYKTTTRRSPSTTWTYDQSSVGYAGYGVKDRLTTDRLRSGKWAQAEDYSVIKDPERYWRTGGSDKHGQGPKTKRKKKRIERQIPKTYKGKKK